jgi:cytochrome c biogenesis protein CcdA
MEYYTLLLLGGLVGMQHVLDADHLAAMATMSTGQSSRRAVLLRGSIWGLGHTITLLTICGVLLIWGGTISDHTQAILQLAVGTMILMLGANVLYRLWRKRPHFHFHHHETGIRHVHAHSHQGELLPHSKNPHPHPHHSLGLGRAMLIGMMHGTAGSAGLLVLAAGTDSVMNALAYVLAFGTGSILGMTILSFVASYPLRFLDRNAGWINTAGLATVGCAAMIIGMGLLVENWAAL